MDAATFTQLVGKTWDAMPERFKTRVSNVALLVEEEPSEETRQQQHLIPEQTLLGLYHGIPAIERGQLYGVGATVPDTITLYRLPLLTEAQQLLREQPATYLTLEDALAKVVRETLWHEVGHYFGLSEDEIDEREEEGSNEFGAG
jgi:predicted Zn-dependent protease with MMP-like domain